ncbi:hypothetical protein LCGC14_0907520 [marine sediment metagenome]|uniref:Uncharacterized protein n=1 Tax=marine sediment metagenome TaxID=412755 RepID=A0A0F9S1H2_9ZZZZ|nr:hypothetical protein [Methylophaga sp.]HEC60384.1 hypothetical protein [Methylophaga sp.]
MIYLIFTPEGFAEAQADILEDKAALWINNNLLSPEQLASLSAHDINVSFLPNLIDARDEKAIIAALEYVETQSPKEEILVEYP